MGRQDTAIVVVIAVAIIAAVALSKCRDRFEAGPQNIGLYDSPYTNYPSYEGRSATQWDADRRCMASCSQSPCTIWCR
jgi:hypothetical protein